MITKYPELAPNCFCSFDEAQRALLAMLLTDGSKVAPRGNPTLECQAVSFTITSPRRRCSLIAARKWSLPLAIGELCWHLSAADDVSPLTYYAPNWRSFADSDGRVRGSCYGSKAFLKIGECSAWERTMALLKHDPDSRRAVLYFNDQLAHLDSGCVDASCANNIQFLIRGNALNAITSMRSNDVIWGLPYDVFLFTFLQELMAASLGIELGVYHHFASSLHLYTRHIGLASRIVATQITQAFCMPALQDVNQISTLLACEVEERTGVKPVVPNVENRYWGDLAYVLYLFRLSRTAGWADTLQSAGRNNPYLPVLQPLADVVRYADSTI